MTAKEIAKSANCSLGWVYKLAKKLNRLPTVEEITERRNKKGRPPKYLIERGKQ